jgi:hypothetical protein
METLLLYRTHDVPTTQHISTAMAMLCNLHTLKLLFGIRGDEFEVTIDVLVAAASNVGCIQDCELPIQPARHPNTNPRDFVQAATTNYYHGSKIIALLLEDQSGEPDIAKDTAKAIQRESPVQVSKLLLEQPHKAPRNLNNIMITAV